MTHLADFSRTKPTYVPSTQMEQLSITGIKKVPLACHYSPNL